MLGKGLLKGALMLVAGALLSLGLAAVLQMHASQQMEAKAARAVPRPAIAHTPVKPAAARSF